MNDVPYSINFRVRKKQDGEVKNPIYLKSLSMVYP